MKGVDFAGSFRSRIDGIVNAPSFVEVLEMKSTKSMLTAIVGFAMIAMPITAAAGDHHRGAGFQSRAGHAYRAPANVRSYAAPVRVYRNPAVRTFVPVRQVIPVVPVRYARHAYNYSTAPAYLPVRHYRDEYCEHPQRNSGWVCDEDGDDCHQVGGYRGNYRNYNNYNYSSAPAYNYGGNSNACIEAQRLANQYRRDMRTGHPAAAQDVLRMMRRAQNACQGGGNYSSYAPAGNGLLGGFLGPQAYGNYGVNSGSYGNGNGYNNGYNNGYAAPYYGNGSSSILAPLLQQFVR